MITSRTKLYAVLGDPVEKSLSPVMHNAWIADHGLDAVYVALRVRDPLALSQIGALGFAGVNVTVPHKEAAFRLAAHACETTTTLRAANVLRFSEDGGVDAFNTDVDGFENALLARWANPGQRALLIGAGGAARAVALSLVKNGFALTITNRTGYKAQDLVSLLNLHAPQGTLTKACDFDDLAAAMRAADLIINALSDDSAIAWDFNGCAAHCVDLRYGAMSRGFLNAAEQAGLETMDGLGMLIHQGAAAFRLWFGVAPDTDKARARLEAVLR